MYPIHNMKEALDFADRFKDGSIWIFRDPKISMPNGGATEIRKKGEDFYSYSSGENWYDQQEEIIADIGSYIWKNRRAIRKGGWL